MKVQMARKNDVIDVKTSVVDVHGKTLFDRVCDYLTEKDWSFSAYADKGYVSFGLRLRDGSVRVVVDATEGAGWSRVLVYCIYSTFVPEQRRRAVSEAIARINYATIFGNFEMDLKDGEVRVRTVLEGDGFVGEPMIDRAVRKSLDLADQYQSALLAIAFGNESPENILEMTERADGSTLQ
jgi:hypothetical protein